MHTAIRYNVAIIYIYIYIYINKINSNDDVLVGEFPAEKALTHHAYSTHETQGGRVASFVVVKRS